MKVLVAVKRVIDYKTQIRIKSDHSGVETTHVKMAMNPFDEIAVEAAVRLKEQGKATEIIAVSIGSPQCSEILRTALAMGADQALHVETDQSIQALAAATILRAMAMQTGAQLVILGKQAIDNDNNQTGQMLAALLQWPQATFASAITLDEKTATVTREVDGGLETIQVTLPAVITTDLRLNEPRYISLPNIVQAKKKPITVIPLTTLGLDTAPRLRILTVTPPKTRQAGVKVETVAELVEKLRHEARVLP